MKTKLPYVLIRSKSAGVFVGTLAERTGDTVTLHDSRRVWYWTGAATLSQLAQEGTSNPEGCKWPCAVARETIFGVIEIIDVTPAARATYDKVPVWTA